MTTPKNKKSKIKKPTVSIAAIGVIGSIVVSAEDGARRTQRVGTLAEFLAASPLRGSGLKVRRPKSGARAISL